LDHPFLDRMRTFGEADAIVTDNVSVSYRDMLIQVAAWRSYLTSQGIQPGSVVVLECPTSTPAACAGLLALIDLGAIIIPLSSLPAAKRQEFIEVAQAEVIVTVSEADRNCQRTGQRAAHALYDKLRDAGRPGLVLFSSGTTGRSKASVLDFEKVLGRYGQPKRPQRILSFLNLDHIGGINTLLHTLSQGGAVITIADRSPDSVFAAVADHDVEVLPTTPTFLNMVLISGVLARHRTTSLQLVTYGTEPMPLRTLQRLKTELPQVRFKQTYGLSELGILPTRSRDDNTLWVRIGGGGFDYKIVDDVLWIRSGMAMLGYLNASAPFDQEGYFNTQDVVQTDGPWIRILGRRSEIINVGGEKVYPSEVENVLLQVPNVAEVTVSGHPSPVTGMVVQAMVQVAEDEDEKAVRDRIREYCRGRLEPYKTPALVRVSTGPQHSERFKKIRG
jgi:acyl-CoA synthetase (AMP-forming)/AMP-acid ligase II